MQIAMFTGAGATGKTTVANLLPKLYRSVVVVPSLTRAAYAKLGVKNESEALAMDPMTFSCFQQDLLDYFTRESRAIIRMHTNSGVELLVFQRSHFDHLAYINVHVGAECSAPHLLKVQVAKAFEASKATMVYFPYPAPWSALGDSGDDKFRQAAAQAHVSRLHLSADYASLLAPYQNETLYLDSFDLRTRVDAVAARFHLTPKG